MTKPEPFWNHVALTYTNSSGLEKHYQFGFGGAQPYDLAELFQRLHGHVAPLSDREPDKPKGQQETEKSEWRKQQEGYPYG